MLPLLQLAGDGDVHKFRDAIEGLSRHFGLTEEERRTLLPSGKQPMFDNRVGWAKTYMAKAGLIESPKRGLFQITDRGRQVIEQRPTEINVNFLEQFDEFLTFRKLRHTRRESGDTVSRQPIRADSEETPEELLEGAYQLLRDDLAAEVIDQVKKCSPQFFERLVVDLLVRMGYGGSRKEAGEAIGRSGDEGIDGIIKEDRLGLDIIYIQAKRWEAVVGRPEIQKFAGALQGQRAKKGVFMTTSGFSREALDYAQNIDTKIILIDGSNLASLMIDNGVGVTTEATYEVKRIDCDYFIED